MNALNAIIVRAFYAIGGAAIGVGLLRVYMDNHAQCFKDLCMFVYQKGAFF